MHDERQRGAPGALDEAVLGLADVGEDLAGSEFIGPPRSKVVAFTIGAVNSSGAVSPAARAIASSTPVTSPGSAVGSTTRDDHAPARRAERERGLAQRVRHELQHDLGERVTIGSISSASATEPFQPAKLPADFPEDQRDVDEEAEHDRRHAGHHVDEVAHERAKRAACRTR